MSPVPAGHHADQKLSLSIASDQHQLVKQSDERTSLWKAEGNARLTAGDTQGALDSYSRGIAAANEAGLKGTVLGQLYANRAQVHMRLKNFLAAFEDCKVAIENDPGNGKAYWRGATAALELDRPQEAAAICMRGIKAVGDSDSLSDLLEEARSKLQVTSLSTSSEEDASRNSAQELADRAASLLDRYILAQGASRSKDDARLSMALFQDCLRKDPNNETALIGLGEIFEEGWGDVAQDSIAAKELWVQAAKSGSQRAQMKLCLQALNGWAVNVRQETFRERETSERAGPVSADDDLF
eukprot:TRINITY_DN50033_c0_g1_i1.p1 TRINITY_DN50033_c0_g1~~TRINITY_DN50033_c0_g1_i1.p1  ORF type:complete len:311 (+),score=77.09 TRINITY_DN50033_c0_g1_i1:41-934(+)